MPLDSLPKIHIPFEMLQKTTYNIHSPGKIFIKRMGLCHWTHSLKINFQPTLLNKNHSNRLRFNRKFFWGKGIMPHFMPLDSLLLFQNFLGKVFLITIITTRFHSDKLPVIFSEIGLNRYNCPVGLTPLRLFLKDSDRDTHT